MRRLNSEFNNSLIINSLQVENDDLSIVISRQGEISVQDNLKLSNLFYTDSDNENVQFPFLKGAESKKTLNQAFPSLKDMAGLKREISMLNERERELSGLVRIEFRRQLSDIRNLYRLIRSEALDPRNQIASRFSLIHRDLLGKNLGKMKANILIAESYCG